MERSLLIIGAGQYGYVARDVAASTGMYETVDFADDQSEAALYTVQEALKRGNEYRYAFVAIGSSEARERLTGAFASAGFKIARLISPKAWVSEGAELGEGCIVEPMAVVNNGAVLGRGTFVCAGAVVNHNAVVGSFCQCDCNCTVAARASVPDGIKISCGTFYEGK